MNTEKQLIKWFISGNTGISSIAITAQMTGNDTGRDFSDYPLDSADFGRCYKLLQAVPEFRQRISEMAERSPQWAILSKNWDELERLYEQDRNVCYWPQSKMREEFALEMAFLCAPNVEVRGAPLTKAKRSR
jgi:hypothetical protein